MYICKKVEGEGAGIEAAQKAAEVKEEGGGLADSGRSEATGKSVANSLETAIHYQVVYNMEITSEEMAASAIKEEGRKQRENYDNPAVEDKMAYVVNGDYGYYPFAEKYYIVLNAGNFCRRGYGSLFKRGQCRGCQQGHRGGHMGISGTLMI